MGRSKPEPKKLKHPEDNWNPAPDFRPVFKRRRTKSNKSIPSYKISSPTEANKQYYLGKLTIGRSNNVIPDKYSECTASFIIRDDEDNTTDTAALKFDDVTVVVHLTIDTLFLKEMIQIKVFSLAFNQEDGDILMEIYLTKLPLNKFYPKLGSCIKTVFKLLYDTGTDTAESQVKKIAHSHKEIGELYREIISNRKYEPDRSLDMQHRKLKPQLRPYQEDAVRWMLHREKMDREVDDKLHPLFSKITLPSGTAIYYDKFSGFIDTNKPVIPPTNLGGILADEMGLGKTVEVFACILNHKKINEDTLSSDSDSDDGHPVITRHSRKRKVRTTQKKYESDTDYVDKSKKIEVPNDWVKKPKTVNRVALEMFYNSTLSEYCTVKSAEKKKKVLVQCICGSVEEEGLIQCEYCEKYQHKECFSYKRSYGMYLCPQCWLSEPLIESGATLIVTPMQLRGQWCEEVKKHIKGSIKVLVYEGNTAKSLYPTELKNYDLVITTYSVLQNELRLTESGQIMTFRNQRKYSSPGSPLTRVKWWRLCLDEAQTVDMPGKMVSEMAKQIEAVHRWAVTGTPISKDISDIYGLVDYLRISPYNDPETWKNILYHPYVQGNKQPMCDFLSEILWRSCKADIINQINIPKQTFKEHLLEFSAVEKYFYKREHELTSNEFLDKVHSYDPELPLDRIDRSTLKKLLGPVITLRQACTHPNTVRGRYLATKKKVSSMKDLLEALILKNTTDSEESLRLVISSLNGLAGIYLLLNQPQLAIQQYRKVLQLSSRFDENSKESKLTVDKLQLIHAMHNLAEIIEIYPPKDNTLRDDTLKSDCADLEKKYIEKFIKETGTQYESTQNFANNVLKTQEKFTMGDAEWYSFGLDWVFLANMNDELISKVQSASENAGVQCNLRFSNDRQMLKNMVFKWDEDLTYLRNELFSAIENLYEIKDQEEIKIDVKEGIVSKATDCHLRPTKKPKRNQKCGICKANDALKQYEARLFSMVQRKDAFDEMSLLGSWKPTLEELIVRSLFSLLKSKSTDENAIKDGEVHSNLIDLLKKEFKEVRKFWTLLDRQICAADELSICKVRLQLKNPEEVENVQEKKQNRYLKNLSYVLENKLENVNLLSEHELMYQLMLLGKEEEQNMAKLENLLGTQSYLETLRKQQYEGQSPDPCPVCKNTLEQHWSILNCGHSYCLECIQLILEQTGGEHLQCSICRTRHKIVDISYIKAGGNVTNEDVSQVKGNFSTKIEAVIKLIIELKSEDPGVKILVFSSWVAVLQCLKNALINNNIAVENAVHGQFEKQIERFKNLSNNITTFLLPINLGSKGLNLIEATQVIFIEPVLNPADELQAIGRVHRIGQTRPTVVHKFLIKNTIEESIHQATTSNAEVWDKNKVTLRQFINLFVNTDTAIDKSDIIVEETGPVINEAASTSRE